MACEAQYTLLKDAIKPDDQVFYLRGCERRCDQENIMSRVKACLEPEPIKYNYHGFFGSCQTFCTMAFGLRNLNEVNFEALMVTGQEWWKKGISQVFDDKKALNLKRLMDERFAQNLPVVILGVEDRLVDKLPDTYDIQCNTSQQTPEPTKFEKLQNFWSGKSDPH